MAGSDPDDTDDRTVVISVVYDGPPHAGKTTSVRALGQSFGREVYTPEERDGRTVFFDFLEHVGGRFEGMPIRCQIASVPGQRHWRRRRAHFLDRADVVVFVGDTTVAGWPETIERLAELRRALDDREGTPVGLVFQANKRDCEDAVPLDEIKRQAANARTAVIESIAHTGTGVRETFVFAVRLALDRVREERSMFLDRPGFGTSGGGADLVDTLRGLDTETHEKPAVAATPDVTPEATSDAKPDVKPDVKADAKPDHTKVDDAWDLPAIPALPALAARPAPATAVAAAIPPALPPATETASDTPRPPSQDTPSGFVWPPVEGRIILREAAAVTPAVRVSLTGDCIAESKDWWLHSSESAVFDDVELARAHLVTWARRHASAQSLLSRPRCIVIAETGDGRWRLWQVVARSPSLRALGETRESMARVVETFAMACRQVSLAVPCNLDTIGMSDAKPVFVGLMPSAEAW